MARLGEFKRDRRPGSASPLTAWDPLPGFGLRELGVRFLPRVRRAEQLASVRIKGVRAAGKELDKKLDVISEDSNLSNHNKNLQEAIARADYFDAILKLRLSEEVSLVGRKCTRREKARATTRKTNVEKAKEINDFYLDKLKKIINPNDDTQLDQARDARDNEIDKLSDSVQQKVARVYADDIYEPYLSGRRRVLTQAAKVTLGLAAVVSGAALLARSALEHLGNQPPITNSATATSVLSSTPVEATSTPTQLESTPTTLTDSANVDALLGLPNSVEWVSLGGNNQVWRFDGDLTKGAIHLYDPNVMLQMTLYRNGRYVTVRVVGGAEVQFPDLSSQDIKASGFILYSPKPAIISIPSGDAAIINPVSGAVEGNPTSVISGQFPQEILDALS